MFLKEKRIVLQTKSFKEYVISTFLMLVFTALSCMLPSVLAFFAGALAAAYLGRQTVRFHYFYIAASAALMLGVISAFGGVYAALLYGIMLVLLGVSLGAATRMKISFYSLLFICAFLYLANSAAGIMLAKTGGEELFSLNYFYETANQTLEIMGNSGYGINPEVLTFLKQYLKDMVLFIMRVTPAMLIVISVVCSFLLIKIYARTARKKQIDTSFILPFERIAAKRHTVILFFAVVLLYSAAPDGMFSDVALNVIFVLMFLFFAAGLSFFDGRLKAKGLKKSRRRIIELALIPVSYMFMFMPVIALAVLGISDGLFDMRKSNAKKEKR